ncbi:unnamed protein product [Amoebophrya sp. A25]|nr:unnamed protein product [Amoebophrya sp. A25]|eukprot:GSA25T00008425001.1
MPSQRNCVKKLQQAVVVGALSSGTCNYAYAYQKIRQSKKNDNQGGPPHDHDESETTRKPCRGNLRGGKPPCDEDDSARSAHTDEKEAQEDVFDETATGPTAFMVTETGRQEQMPKDKPKPKGKRTSKRNKATGAGAGGRATSERKATPSNQTILSRLLLNMHPRRHPWALYTQKK